MPLSDDQWATLSSLLPTYKASPKGGRPRLNKRKVLEGIVYVFQNRTAWKAVPKKYGSGTALNDYFRGWAKSGVFHKLKEKYGSLFLCLDWNKIDTLKEQSVPIGNH